MRKSHMWAFASFALLSLGAAAPAEAASVLGLSSENAIVRNYTIGGPQPVGDSRIVTNIGTPFSVLEYSVFMVPNNTWLSVTPNFGALLQGNSAPVIIGFDTTGLTQGSYFTEIVFQNNFWPANYEVVPVYLQVDMPAANLELDSIAPVALVYDIGGPLPADFSRVVSNVAPPGSELHWNLLAPIVPWLHPVPTQGVLVSGGFQQCNVAVDISGLAPGVYNTKLRFQNQANPADFAEFPVSLEVRLPKADLCLDSSVPIAVAFDIGGAVPPPVARVVSNCGDDYSMLGWAVTETPNASWLQFGPSSGSLAKNASTPVTFNFMPDSLSAGNYVTKVRFQNVNEPLDYEEFLVTLAVSMPAADLSLDSTVAVNDEYVIGFDAPLDIMRYVSNSGPVGSSLTWAVVADPPAPWLFIGPTAGLLGPGEMQKVVAAYDLVGLPAGMYSTTLNFVNAVTPADKEQVVVSLKVIDPIPDLGLIGDPLAFQVDYTIGQPLPADIPVMVENRGHPMGTLNFGIMPLFPAPWLTATPWSGSIGPNGLPVNVALNFNPANLVAGSYLTVLRFENLNDAGDHVEVNITFNIVEPAADLTLDSTAPVVDEYVIGFDVPLNIMRTVTNNGPVGSELNWVVFADPSAPWLFIGPTGGLLESGKSQAVQAIYNLVNLAHGVYNTKLRFVNTDNPADFEEVMVQLTVTDPIPDLALGNGLLSVTQQYTIGEPIPAKVPVVVENVGHAMATLNYSINPEPPVSWLTVTPMSGSILPNELMQNVELAFNPVGLPNGQYDTVLRFENLQDALDFVELPVTLTIGNIVFVPGDNLIGAINKFDKTHEVEFDGVAGMRIKFTATSPDGKTKVQVTLVDDQGEVVAARAMKASKKGVTKSMKLQTSGRHALRVELFKGELGGFDLATNRKLPKRAKKYKITGTGNVDDVLPAPVLALPGAVLDLKATPMGGGFAGPLGLGVSTPAGQVFNAAAFSQALGNGGIQLIGVPLLDVGEWVVKINGFNNKSKNQAKVVVIPTQPPKGTNTIFLP